MAVVLATSELGAPLPGKQFDDMRDGWRYRSFAMCGTPSNPLYVAVWKESDAGFGQYDWGAYFGVSGEAPPGGSSPRHLMAAELKGLGYEPKFIAAVGSESEEPVFSAVYERDDEGTGAVVWDVSQEDLQDKLQEYRELNYFLRWAALYDSPDGPQFGLVFWQYFDLHRVPFGTLTASDMDTILRKADAMTAGHLRVDLYIRGDFGRDPDTVETLYLGNWLDRPRGTKWASFLWKDEQETLDTIAKHAQEHPPLVPYRIQAWGPREERNLADAPKGGPGNVHNPPTVPIHYSVVFIEDGSKFAERTFYNKGWGLAGHWAGDALKSIVQVAAQTVGARSAQLAIAVDGKLKYNRTFNWCEDDYDPCYNYDKFRFWSVSKTITAAMIHRLNQDQTTVPPWTLEADVAAPGSGTRIQDIIKLEQLDGTSMTSSQQPNYVEITLQQAMAHRTGLSDTNWHFSGTTYAQILVDERQIEAAAFPVGAAATANYPLEPDAFMSWIAQDPANVPDTPGTVQNYSNFGYFLLGRAIERSTIDGQTRSYEDAVNEILFAPIGVDKYLQLGPMQDVPSMPRFYMAEPGLSYSVLDPATFVTLQQEYLGLVVDEVEVIDFSKQPLVPKNYWLDVNTNDADAGWVGPAAAYVRFLAAFDVLDSGATPKTPHGFTEATRDLYFYGRVVPVRTTTPASAGAGGLTNVNTGPFGFFPQQAPDEPTEFYFSAGGWSVFVRNEASYYGSPFKQAGGVDILVATKSGKASGGSALAFRTEDGICGLVIFNIDFSDGYNADGDEPGGLTYPDVGDAIVDVVRSIPMSDWAYDDFFGDFDPDWANWW